MVLNRALPGKRPSSSTSSRMPCTPASIRLFERGYYRDAGIDLRVQEPSASTDAPKLLRGGPGRVRDPRHPRPGLGARARPRRGGNRAHRAAPAGGGRWSIQSRSAGLVTWREEQWESTGLPSDDAVLDSVLEADGADPDAVDRVTIGFNAVAALAAGRVDAATAFWNAEGLEAEAPRHPDRRISGRRLRRPALSGARARHLSRADRIRPRPGGIDGRGHRTRVSLRRFQLPLRIRLGHEPLGPARRYLRP